LFEKKCTNRSKHIITLLLFLVPIMVPKKEISKQIKYLNKNIITKHFSQTYHRYEIKDVL